MKLLEVSQISLLVFLVGFLSISGQECNEVNMQNLPSNALCPPHYERKPIAHGYCCVLITRGETTENSKTSNSEVNKPIHYIPNDNLLWVIEGTLIVLVILVIISLIMTHCCCCSRKCTYKSKYAAVSTQDPENPKENPPSNNNPLPSLPENNQSSDTNTPNLPNPRPASPVYDEAGQAASKRTKNPATNGNIQTVSGNPTTQNALPKVNSSLEDPTIHNDPLVHPRSTENGRPPPMATALTTTETATTSANSTASANSTTSANSSLPENGRQPPIATARSTTETATTSANSTTDADRVESIDIHQSNQ